MFAEIISLSLMPPDPLSLSAMRKHGWQLPYHPLQVVAIAVFLALVVAFYVFFAPFLGEKKLEYLAIGLYTPLVSCVFFFYIWCAAADPADEGVFTSKKHLKAVPEEHRTSSKRPRRGNGSISSVLDEKSLAKETAHISCFCPLSRCRPRGGLSEQASEDGSFYCSLCEVEVYKYSKHCRICDKCVDGFDHHCRWLNNCVGRKNYLGFFVLMISALLLLILQWSVGMFIIIRCLLKQKEFTGDIKSKLGSCFSFSTFLVVVGSCSFLALVATLPLAQLFFFHVLLVKKGISTYDYILAMREQEHQAPTTSPASSITGLSSTSSFTHFRRGAWCNAPHLFLEDHEFDVAVPEIGGSFRPAADPGRINPWKLARMNGDEVAKAAAEARKRSRTLHPSFKRGTAGGMMESDSASSSMKTIARHSAAALPIVFTHGDAAESQESSSPGSPPCFRRAGVFSSGMGDGRRGSESDGYEASGGEDSDRILPSWRAL